MKSFATFGNELYTGERSYEFIGKRKIWFSITGVLVVLSILIPILGGGFNFGIEFRGGSQFTVSKVTHTDVATGQKAVAEAIPGTAAVVTNIASDTMQVQTDKLTDDQTIAVKNALKTAYGVSEDQITST